MHTVDTVHVVLTLVERHWKAVAAHSARCVSERYNTFRTNGYGMRCYDLATSTPMSITVIWNLQHATPPTDTRKPVDYHTKHERCHTVDTATEPVGSQHLIGIVFLCCGWRRQFCIVSGRLRTSAQIMLPPRLSTITNCD